MDHLLINIFITLLSVGEADTGNVTIGNQAILLGASAGANSPNIASNEILIGANCPATNVNGRLSFYSMEAVATTATAGVRTLPANPSAFMPIVWNGTLYKVPLYNN